MRDSHGPAACRDIRHLLGVYVVGAIDPSDRAIVDNHLPECQACRDDLAGLAGLPAMLSRVPAADVESLSMASMPDDPAPPDEMLNSLLSRVSVRRRNRLWRGAITVAAAAALAAAGATAAMELASPAAQPAQTEVASATTAHGHVAVVVDYAGTPWNTTTMRVHVRGIPVGTTCDFWAVTANGKHFAGTWTVKAGYGDAWYSVASRAPLSSVRSFQITAGSKVLVTIPAT
jgi:anti-sigma-K factor RskA